MDTEKNIDFLRFFWILGGIKKMFFLDFMILIKKKWISLVYMDSLLRLLVKVTEVTTENQK